MIPTGIELQVCQDIAGRQQRGIAKYGQTVADNPIELRAWLVHAYEENLDFCIYLKRAISEIDKKHPSQPTTKTMPDHVALNVPTAVGNTSHSEIHLMTAPSGDIEVHRVHQPNGGQVDIMAVIPVGRRQEVADFLIHAK